MNKSCLNNNPLGIIGMFISLCYGMASMVIGFNFANLQGANERLPLVWFIVIFPVIILIVFVLLVILHHEKLYSPQDFRSDESFFIASAKDIDKKQNDEISELKEAKDEIEHTNQDSCVHNHNDAQNQVTKMLLNAEKWAVRELGTILNLDFQNGAAIRTKNGERLLFDAGIEIGPKKIFMEVKFMTSGVADHAIIVAKTFARKTLDVDPKLTTIFLVFVTEDTSNVKSDILEAEIRNINPNLKLMFMLYKDLQKKYESNI